MRSQSNERISTRGRRKWLKYALMFTLIFGLIAAVYISYLGYQFIQAWDKMQDGDLIASADVISNDPQLVRRDLENESFTVLLLGIDDQDTAHMQGRSDVIMLAVVDPVEENVTLLSIPRDTYAKISGRGHEKINHAHAYGRNIAISTISDFLDVDIDYYVAINFDAYKDYVDRVLNGLKIETERAMYHHYVIDNLTINIQKGEQTLDGNHALFYVRFRGDSEGDFGRQRRQQQSLRAMLDQSISLRSITRVPEVLDIMGDNVRHNVSEMSEMINLARKLSAIGGDDVRTIAFENPELGYKDGISYVFIDEDEQLRMQQKLNEMLAPKVVYEYENEQEQKPNQSSQGQSISP